MVLEVCVRLNQAEKLFGGVALIMSARRLSQWHPDGTVAFKMLLYHKAVLPHLFGGFNKF